MNGSNSIETNRMDYNPISTYRYLLDLSEINSIHIGGISDVYISFDDVLWKKELRSSDLCHTETNMKKTHINTCVKFVHWCIIRCYITGWLVLWLPFSVPCALSFALQHSFQLLYNLQALCRRKWFSVVECVWLKSLFFVSVFFLLCKHWFGVIIMVFINVYNIHKSNKIVINYLNGI